MIYYQTKNGVEPVIVFYEFFMIRLGNWYRYFLIMCGSGTDADYRYVVGLYANPLENRYRPIPIILVIYIDEDRLVIIS
jgi:hypothetical protein